MKCIPSKRGRIAGAIRPLDVAAIICVIAVLALLGFLVSDRIRERAIRSRCAGNLARIGQGLGLYSSDNRGELPDCTGQDPRYGQTGWPWNLSTNLINELGAKGLTRETYYCPANPGMNDDRHWNFWRAFNADSRVIGYGMLFKGTSAVAPNSWVTRLAQGGAAPSQTELGFDATASQGDDYTRIQGLWIDRSNHMRKSSPLGGNILFADQHVSWRDFGQMRVRFQTPGPGGTLSWRY
jgi:hypothetical protein